MLPRADDAIGDVPGGLLGLFRLGGIGNRFGEGERRGGETGDKGDGENNTAHWETSTERNSHRAHGRG